MGTSYSVDGRNPTLGASTPGDYFTLGPCVMQHFQPPSRTMAPKHDPFWHPTMMQRRCFQPSTQEGPISLSRSLYVITRQRHEPNPSIYLFGLFVRVFCFRPLDLESTLYHALFSHLYGDFPTLWGIPRMRLLVYSGLY